MFYMQQHMMSLYTHSGQVFLGQAFVLSALLDDLAHLQGHPVVVQLLSLPVQFGCVPCHEVLFVLPCRPCVTEIAVSVHHATK